MLNIVQYSKFVWNQFILDSGRVRLAQQSTTYIQSCPPKYTQKQERTRRNIPLEFGCHNARRGKDSYAYYPLHSQYTQRENILSNTRL